MIKKLRRKFVLIIMIIVTIMLTAMAGMTYLSTRSNLENENLHMMKAAADRPIYNKSSSQSAPSDAIQPSDIQPSNIQPGDNGSDDIKSGDIRSGKVFPGSNIQDSTLTKDAAPDANSKHAEPQPFFIVHLSADGQRDTFGSSYYDLTDEDFLTEIVNEASSSDTDIGLISSYSLRFYKQELPDGESIVFSDTSAQTTALHHMARNLLLISCAGFVIFLILSILLSRWAVRPVEQAWNQQKQFISDASHELKTPLTVIMTNAELASESDYDTSEHQHFISNIQTESKHMHHLVEQMLELARADHAAENKAATVFSGSEVINASVMTMEAALFEMGHAVESAIENDIHLKGDANQIRQLVEILLDNAGKYAAEGSTIHLSFNKHGKNHALLSVTNEGAPISEDVLKNLFKRFYRADEARSRDGSFGLGLAIAERIVSAHDGKIRAESRDGWNTFSVILPASWADETTDASKLI